MLHAGNVYIADRNNDRIMKWDVDGTTVNSIAGWNGRGGNANQLNHPMDVAIDVFGNILIADADNHRVQEWKPSATKGFTVAGGNREGGQCKPIKLPDRGIS